MFVYFVLIQLLVCLGTIAQKPLRVFKKGDIKIYSNDKYGSLSRFGRFKHEEYHKKPQFDTLEDQNITNINNGTNSEIIQGLVELELLYKSDINDVTVDTSNDDSPQNKDNHQTSHHISKRQVTSIQNIFQIFRNRSSSQEASEVIFTAWGEWSVCQVTTCGEKGLQKRSRTCYRNQASPDDNTSPECEYDSLVDFKMCDGPTCEPTPEQTVAEIWTDWTECSISCGTGGVQSRSKTCFGSNAQKVICAESSQEVRPCQHAVSCPYWGQWGDWSVCSRSCGRNGEERRERKCYFDINITFRFMNVGDVSNSGEVGTSPHHNNNNATMTSSNTFRLSTTRAGKVTWISPDESMFINDEHIAVYVKNHHLQNTGASKVAIPTFNVGGSMQELVNPVLCGTISSAVNTRTCAPSGLCAVEWGEWEPWSKCSVTCGAGLSRTQRQCIGETIDNSCPGKRYNYRRCYSPPCWSSWTSISECSTSCGGRGLRLRNRHCMGTTTIVEGYSACPGRERELTACSSIPCTTVWNEWSEFGECSASCGTGFMRRTRTCKEGSNCSGDSESTQPCNTKECPRWGDWGDYSCCSVNCGNGYRTRNRKCYMGEIGQDGCIGEADETVPCYKKPCGRGKVNVFDTFKCGHKDLSSLKLASIKIFGGNNADAHEWPWQVSCQHWNVVSGEWTHFCGGTLIAPRWVISAGHCTEESGFELNHDDPGSDWSIVIGMQTLQGGGFRQYLEKIIVHPNYAYRAVTNNDIELIKLKEVVDLSDRVFPACLPKNSAPKVGEHCYITGWGYTDAFHEDLSTDLLEASIPIMKFSECQDLGMHYKLFLRDRIHMCAGYPETAKADSCVGDSGGPLVCLNNKKAWYIAGVTSFAFEACGTPGHVGIYAPMVTYEKWIKKTIEKQNYDNCVE